MAEFKTIVAIVGIIATIYLLIKKYETRTVLIGVGLVMAVLALNPMGALDAFAKSMTSGGLIMAICSSMGFAYVMKYTECDTHLVHLLTKPLSGLKFFLIPIATIITFFINIAIPSAAGCAAAVGATLIPVLKSAGVRPAMAGAAILAGTFGSMMSPGSSHSAMISEMSGLTITEVNLSHAPYTIIAGAIGMVVLTLLVVVFKDYGKEHQENYLKEHTESESHFSKVNVLYAIAPLVPLIILVIGGTSLQKAPGLEWTKMGVPQAMLIGTIYAIVVTRTSPSKITNEFFNGMGNAYANVLGIIIAASVFVAGLKATGAIDSAIEFLKHSNEFVRWGATIGPFLMGLITGSGDAAAIAFNTAVTPHAPELGYTHVNLGMASAIAGAIGRTASPIAGVTIVCAGLAGVSPVEIIKRTAPGMILAVLFLAFFML
ncbi:C4-dicarboxylate transporter DcuC [Ursidibacter maritimus]|uniref:C4-dicarboxylate transporter DcuC n=1 Tax=Ursidibacter maritimus TaxID=1331689 RepID=A0A949T1F3_9PAST|nr:C4-dicarboxylate transporter DcuC [Ursidibacter maritimus]KAE9538319.1 C4-dicarboxylate ABC transporter [Ursidibacter maritimus]MBV6523630.1 C4-dicarboxylate transporter DcuC [Ursidibacter maritimus]MBV6525523.1 C4-dicarboxylate transporter DcuC [Ursidibacter maritimus]MBV6527608.1 C4-dicarboxylate transporter DcuC [Ursidibacter maritimus]MBV6529695.1 C4-dicarboxylate transporter DcuC [Ursidibacter maritimus]